MTKFLSASLLALSLLGASLVAHAEVATECELPTQPIVPDGNVASMDELVAAQTAIKAYQANLGDYRVCLQEAETALDPDSEQLEADKLSILELYNTSVDQEKDTVDNKFNAAVKAYKTRNPS